MPGDVPDSTPPPTAPGRSAGSGIVVPQPPSLLQRIGARAVFIIERSVTATHRYHWVDRSGFLEKSDAPPAIYCIWHNRLALCMQMYLGYIRKHNRTAGLAAMVSASKDGAFLARSLECFGVQPVRGSTSRRGRQALLELSRWARQGYDLAITPDGPRGPCYQVQPGVMSLAQITGLPIIPVSYHADWRIRIRSWDTFLIPLPFSRCEMIFEKPIRVPREATEEQRETLRRELENTLKGISRD